MFSKLGFYLGFTQSPQTDSVSPAPAGELTLLTEKVAHRNLLIAMTIGLSRSKFIRATLLSALAIGVLFAVYYSCQLGMPPPWMITAVGVGGYIIGLGLQLLTKKQRQKASFEITSFERLFNKNYNLICTVKNKEGVSVNIFLGALPNRVSGDGHWLVNHKGVEAVLSLNENWELFAYGLSVPEDWSNFEGVDYKRMEIKDHTLLNDQHLNEAADFIKKQVDAGKSIYVHCRAGHGRSAMAIAAYLIKYHNSKPATAKELILAQRPTSTIEKKVERLKDYRRRLDPLIE